jgi:hypothetical protein
MREHTAMRYECFSIGAIPSERPCHLLAQLIDLLLRSRVEGIPRAECSTLAITEELPRADLIAAGCKS